MYKSRSVLINFYACLKQFVIIILCYGVNIPLIRNMRCYYSDIYPRKCGKFEAFYHRTVYYKIRRCYINIALCRVKDLHIYALCRIFIVKRTVAIRQNVAFFKNFFFFLRSPFSLSNVNFYMLSHDSQSVKKFFRFLLRFLSFFFQKCVSHVQRILYYHKQAITSSTF